MCGGAFVKGDLCQLRTRDWGSAGCRHRGCIWGVGGGGEGEAETR